MAIVGGSKANLPCIIIGSLSGNMHQSTKYKKRKKMLKLRDIYL